VKKMTNEKGKRPGFELKRFSRGFVEKFESVKRTRPTIRA
jgi:hypothetical protein